MKRNKIYFIVLISIIVFLGLVGGFLLHKRVIWFVYPNKSIYSIDGLDVSNHQGFIDWEKVDKKYLFVFIKASEGDDFVDKRFYENINGAKNTNRIAGAYHFFHFNYPGIEQAANFINTVGDLIDLPPVVDFEFSGNLNSFDKEKTLNELKQCIEELEKYYKCKVIIYTTKDAYKHVIKDNFDNPIWYRSIITPIKKDINNVLFWQYHNSAIIKGITEEVDLNVFKGNKEDLMKLIME
jgi:lysozyme